jgi:hypothetical protein
MRRLVVSLAALTLSGAGCARSVEAGTLAPRMTIENEGRKSHVITILGANLVMVAGLNRSLVMPVMSALDRHLQARLSAGQPAVVYPEVVLSIVKSAVLRGWTAADTATVLVGALRKIDEGHSPEMTRQKVVLAIMRNEGRQAVLGALVAEPVATGTAPE